MPIEYDSPEAVNKLSTALLSKLSELGLVLQSEATRVVDAGSDSTTPRPAGWGSIIWIVNSGVVLDNSISSDIIFERE